MDAARIRSFAPAVDTRAATGTDTQAGRSDADIVVSKVAPLLALDSMLTQADSALGTEVPAGAHPSGSVVVDLTLPVVSAEAARRLARALADAPDYNHLDPHKPHPERTLADAAQALADELEAANVQRAAPLVAHAGHDHVFSAATSPGARPDLHPHGVPQPAHAAARLTGSGQKHELSAVAQARDSERLAGLAIAAERYAGTPAQLGRLALGAAMLGALIVVLLS
jgi:hypothetical protein